MHEKEKKRKNELRVNAKVTTVLTCVIHSLTFFNAVLQTWKTAANARSIFSDSKYLRKFIVFSHTPDHYIYIKKKKRKLALDAKIAEK